MADLRCSKALLTTRLLFVMISMNIYSVLHIYSRPMPCNLDLAMSHISPRALCVSLCHSLPPHTLTLASTSALSIAGSSTSFQLSEMGSGDAGSFKTLSISLTMAARGLPATKVMYGRPGYTRVYSLFRCASLSNPGFSHVHAKVDPLGGLTVSIQFPASLHSSLPAPLRSSPTNS